MKTNLVLSGGYHHKWLTDEQSSVGSTNKKKSDVIPLTLSFDRKDSFGGGGVSYGAVTWTHGVLDLDSTLATADRTTARSEGHFDKINFDFTRLQLTPINNLTGFAHISAQKAFDNLDSSEDFSLGGVSGVRAYPTGEGYGDEGYVIQLEARYKLNDKIEPYLFYDQGYSRTNQDPWVAGNNNRNINGAGIGLRLNHKNLNIDASAAWSTNGGSPVSDNRDEVPVVWLKANYSF